MDSAIFRSYDIRGIVGETLTVDDVHLIGKGIAALLHEHNEKHVLIARDGRTSGDAFSHALTQGFLSSGCEVIDLGMVPTPLLYYGTAVLNISSGVMITGSHNPAHYNGFKIVVKNNMLCEEDLQALFLRIHAKAFVEGKSTYRTESIEERYIQEIKRTVPLKRSLRVVIDAGNGIAGIIAPQLYEALGCEVIPIFCNVDGNFPNHEADPTQVDNMQTLIAAVIAHQADIGFGFDGDGDRLGVVTNRGEIIHADRILMLFAQSILAKTPGAKIIYDVKCTDQLDKLIRDFKGEPLMWKTGHSLIKAKMRETEAQLAGEMSGHFFFRDRWYGFDDALYAGARLLEILSAEDKSSHDVFAALPNSVNTPELKVPVSEAEKFEVMAQLMQSSSDLNARLISQIDGLRVHFDEGWGLVRASNTSPYLIMRFEAINEQILAEIQKLFRHWMLSIKPDFALPF